MQVLFLEVHIYLKLPEHSGDLEAVQRVPGEALMDLTMIMSTLPRLHWRMSLLIQSRFFILVPVIPLSA